LTQAAEKQCDFFGLTAYTFILQIVAAVYAAALLSQASRFVEYDFESVNVTSLVDSSAYVTGCRYKLTSFIGRHQQVGARLGYKQRI